MAIEPAHNSEAATPPAARDLTPVESASRPSLGLVGRAHSRCSRQPRDVRRRLRAAGAAGAPPGDRETRQAYCLSSLVHCGICGRRMAGSWNHDQAHYRCGFPAEYAGATGQHPRWVYLRESEVTAALVEWLLRHFDPESVDVLVEALAPPRPPTTRPRPGPRRPGGPWPTARIA